MSALSPVNQLPETGETSGSPYFNLFVLPGSQAISWSASLEDPVAAPFKLQLYMYDIPGPKITWEINFDNNAPAWLTLTGNSVQGNLIVVTGGTQKNLVPVIGNITVLPDGDYTAEIVFNAYDFTNNWYSSTSYIVTLSIYNGVASAISFGSPQYNVVFNRQNDTLSGQTDISITNNNNVQLTFAANYFQTQQVTGNFTLLGDNLAGNTALPTHGTVTSSAQLKKPDGSVAAAATINLTVVENDDILANKDSMAFQVTKSGGPSAAQVIIITNIANHAYTITAPSWLTLTPTSGNASGNVSVVAAAGTMAVGLYSGNIEISYNGKTITIPVTMKVIGFMNFSFVDGNNFCKDIPPVWFDRMNVAARFVRITVTSKFEVMGETSTQENVYLVPYVGDTASFDLGEKIHRLYPRYRGPMFDEADGDYMKASSIKLTAEELDIAYAVLLTESIADIRLLPGKKPSAFPYISNYRHRSRRRGSVIFINSHKSNKIVFQKLTDPDVTEMAIWGTTLQLYPFPETVSRVDIQWETDNLVQDWATFTGEFKISADFNIVAAKSIFVGLSEKFDSTKVRTLSINTGFILREEIELLSEIILSRLVFFRIYGKVYRAFATTTKMIEADTADEIIARDIEFLIVEK